MGHMEDGHVARVERDADQAETAIRNNSSEIAIWFMFSLSNASEYPQFYLMPDSNALKRC